MNARYLVSMVTLVLISLPAIAQSGKVLKGQEITESALIDALTQNEGIRTRSIRVMRDDESGGAVVKPASASLLITFETNSANLTARAKQSLDVVGQALSSNKLSDFRFAIEGHADPRGVSAANLKLSQLRAESVRQYLIMNNHIDNNRLEAIGKGDRELLNRSNPIAPENRRVTIVNLSQ